MDVVAEKVKVGDSEVISCDLTKLKDTVDLPLSLFAEELQLVKLDNRDEALVGGGATFVSERYILVRNNRNNPFKLFDKSGKFITAIGAFGQGPNEYQNVYDEWLGRAGRYSSSRGKATRYYVLTCRVNRSTLSR